MKGKLLIVDDNEEVLLALRLSLASEFDAITTEKDPSSIPNLIASKNFDVVILDMNFRAGTSTGNEGLYWLSRIQEIDNDIAVVFITAYADVEIAVKGIQLGAADFIEKPWDDDKLRAAILRAKNLRKSRKEVSSLKSHQKSINRQLVNRPTAIVAESPAMIKILETIGKVANTDANILLLGENGTGKEVIAREIHNRSLRTDAIFMAVDLGALSPTLFESELFGHAKGAFTDAKEERLGRFEVANGGTLFLDEIGNLQPYQQAKLLTALQTKSITRVGSSSAITVDIRLICATNSNIPQMVQQGQFREDLFYRINTIQIEVPPLRSRKEDIVPLVNHFIGVNAKKYNKTGLKLSPSAQKKLQQYSWPGNVRQLEHAVEKAIILSCSSILTFEDFFGEKLPNQNLVASTTLNLEENEKRLILSAIEQNRGNLTKAAADLGVSRKTLYNKIERYGI
jgi:DNA-binding NtrC family response regulator